MGLVSCRNICSSPALGIAAAVKHFSPFIIQFHHPVSVLTDSKPCVQAYNKLCRGEFSSRARVATFLATASRFQVSIYVILLDQLTSLSQVAMPLNVVVQIVKYVHSLT